MKPTGNSTFHASCSWGERSRPVTVALDAGRSDLTSARPDGPPCPRCEVRFTVRGQLVSSFRWGEAQYIGTASFWIDQARRGFALWRHELGHTLVEETVACILGGFGVRTEVQLAAFRHLVELGLVTTEPPPEVASIESALRVPIDLSDGRRATHYRFPRQRAERIHFALVELRTDPAIDDPRELRDWLMRLPGVGPKTASWIVRNRTKTDSVAVIDVHVLRAGLAAGVFSPIWRLPEDYSLVEAAFLAYAALGGVSPSVWMGASGTQCESSARSVQMCFRRRVIGRSTRMF